MDQESNQMEQHPVQCRNGCGFYSNAGTDGLCSVCYKDMIKKKQQPPTNMPASLAPTPGSMATLTIDEANSSSQSSSVETATPTVIIPQAEKAETDSSASSTAANNTSIDNIDCSDTNPSTTSTSSLVVDLDTSNQKGDESGKKKKNRCRSCKKKVGLTGFTCRCGGLFCSIHRYSDKHDCKFDYKELGAEEIRKSNPVVVANKVQKI